MVFSYPSLGKRGTIARNSTKNQRINPHTAHGIFNFSNFFVEQNEKNFY